MKLKMGFRKHKATDIRWVPEKSLYSKVITVEKQKEGCQTVQISLLLSHSSASYQDNLGVHKLLSPLLGLHANFH